MTTPEQNKAIIRKQHDSLSRGDAAAAIEDFAADTENHGRPVGRKGVERVLVDHFQTFSDYRSEILDIVAADDTVVVRVKCSGLHSGVGKMPIQAGIFMGVPPTGRRFEVQHIHWYKLRDGKIVQHYACRDDVGQMQQLGLLPPPPHGATPPSTR